MGHIFDKNFSFGIPSVPAATYVAAGAATFSFSYGGHIWTLVVTAGGAGASVVVQVAVRPPVGQGEAAQKGFYLKSLDLWYLTVDAVSSLNMGVYLATLPADGAAWGAPASQAFTYDAAHDTNGERVANAYHKMTLTITAPFWIPATQICTVEYALSLGNDGQIYLTAARANGYLRW